MKTNESLRLVLNRETLRKLAAPERPADDKGFIFHTRLTCYSPISCPVPCA